MAVSSPETKTDKQDAQGYGSSSLGGILKKAMSLVGARVGGNLLTLGYTLILARVATPAEFGLVMTGFAWAMLLSIALALNVESGSIKYLVQYREGEKQGLAAGFIRFNRTIILALTALSFAVMGVLWFAGVLSAQDQTVQIFALALAAAPVVALTRVYARHATAMGQVLRGGLPIMLVRPGVICLLLLGVWFAGVTPGPTTLMFLLIAAFVATAAVQALLLRKTFAFAKEATPEYSERRKWLGTGAMMAPLLVLRDNLKHVVIASAGLVLEPAQVGFLALAMSIMALVYFAMKAVDISLSPQLSQALQNGYEKRVAHLLKSGAKLKTLGIVAGVVFIALFGNQILALFGEKYVAALGPLLVLMLIPAADAIFGPAQIVLNVTGRQSAVFWVAGISSGVLCLATIVGGWVAGTNGAALGAGLSYVLQQMLLRNVSVRSAGVETSILALKSRSMLQNEEKK